MDLADCRGNAFGPLRGIRVLDLTSNIAGPFASLILADLGADVVKIEPPKGDDARGWGPPFDGDDGTMFTSVNRNKRSVVLDLTLPESVEVMKRLAERSDVLITSFRPGALERLGFGEAWARSVKSDLIYVDISAFGNEGPMRNRPGYDPLVQAFAGLMSVTGNTGEEPVRVGVSIIDLSTGMWAAMGTLAALYEQKSTSLGTRVSTSLFESGLNWMSAHVGNYSASGQLPARMGSGSVSIVPYQVFPTSDGERVIAAGSDRLFAKLAQVLDCPEWLEDARFTSNGERVRNRLALIPLVRAETMKWPNDKLALALEEAGVPSSPLNDVSGVLKEPQTEALKIVQHLRSDSERSITVGLPFTLGGKRPGTRMPPPRLGEHTDEILSELELGQTSDEGQL